MMRFLSTFFQKRAFWVGLFLVVAYWWSVHPLGFSNGYAEDFCFDIVRQVMSENLDRFGKPTFHTDSFMAPQGVSMPYMSWSIERDWIGAYVWKWDSAFPFAWAYYGVSLLLSYLGVGLILRKMGLKYGPAWGLAAAAVVFHIPRHFKTWHHMEHLPEHWIYLSFFLDAWIWQRFWKEKKWAVALEFWRGVLILATLMSAGYFWGPMILEWLIFRLSLLGWMGWRYRKGIRTQVELKPSQLVIPSAIGLCLIVIEARWFIPLAQEVATAGWVDNNLGWFARPYHAIRPIWMDLFLAENFKIYSLAETTVTLGWFIVLPFFLALRIIRKKAKGSGVGVLFPFLIFLVLTFLWQSRIWPIHWIDGLRRVIPFLSFFRVSTRWSLFYPASLFTVIALAWPEVSSYVKSRYRESKKFRLMLYLFLISSAVELLWLLHPVNMMPPLPGEVKEMLNEVKSRPQSTVLDLPFCVAGGNGVCTEEQCPNYPEATIGQCLRAWHTKKVFGLYQARMNQANCETYRKAPFNSWFHAWREQRCFTNSEWNDFCAFLDQNEMAAVLLHPEIWKGSASPECLSEFERRLGPAIRTVWIPAGGTFGGKLIRSERLMYFESKCRK